MPGLRTFPTLLRRSTQAIYTVADLEYFEKPQLKRTVLIAAFAGWPDASEAATRAARYIVRDLGATRFAAIDPEEFYVYTEQRPIVSTTRSGTRRISWPKNRFYAWRPEDPSKHDIVIMIGAEPQLRWKRFSELVLDVVNTCNVELMVTLGALLDGVPHTRPARVTTSASSTNLGGDFSDIRWGPSRYEGPTGITSILTDSLTRHGIECVSLWGHAPHYLQVRPNPVVTLALLQAAQRFIPQTIDIERMEMRAKDFDSTVARALRDQEQVRDYVSQLEQKYDSDAEAEEEDAAIPEGDAESLVADVEEFLRRSSDGPNDGEPPVG